MPPEPPPRPPRRRTEPVSAVVHRGDVAEVRALWRRTVPPPYRNLLDARVIPDPDDDEGSEPAV